MKLKGFHYDNNYVSYISNNGINIFLSLETTYNYNFMATYLTVDYYQAPTLDEIFYVYAMFHPKKGCSLSYSGM